MIHKNLELSVELYIHPCQHSLFEAVFEGFWKFGDGGSCFLSTSFHVPTKEELCPFSICCFVLYSAKNHMKGAPRSWSKPRSLFNVFYPKASWLEFAPLDQTWGVDSSLLGMCFSCRIHHLLAESCGVGNSWEESRSNRKILAYFSSCPAHFFT